MSNDMKICLKVFAALGILAGSVFFVRSQLIASRERLMIEEVRREEEEARAGKRLYAEREAKRDADRRASASRNPPQQPPQKGSSARLHHVTFSPDHRFLSAIAQAQTVNELVVWPASGGATLLRQKLDFANYPTTHWKDENRLLADDIFYRIHKDRGYWELSKIGSLHLQRRDGNWVDRFRDFPQQDLRLQVENYSVSQGNVSHTKGRLAAYSLVTGIQLPLPAELQTQNDLENMRPLARWGKAPLRLVQWKSFDRPTSYGLESSSVLMVWDVRSKKRLWKKSFPETNGNFLIGSEGKFLVALGTPRRQPTIPDPPGTEYYYNGKRVNKLPGPAVTYSFNGIEVYDSSTGKLLAQNTVDGMMHREAIISADGKFFAVPVNLTQPQQTRTRDFLYIYEARTLRLIKKVAAMSSSTPAGFSPDNKYLMVATPGKLHLYNWQMADASGKAPSRVAWL